MTYNVIVTREGEDWLASVEGVAGAHTFARNLPGLEHEVREMLALALDLPEGHEAEDALDLTWSIHTGDEDLDRLSSSLREERVRLARAERELASKVAELARQLRRTMSVRDVAVLLGVSPQRVSQISPGPSVRMVKGNPWQKVDGRTKKRTKDALAKVRRQKADQ